MAQQRAHNALLRHQWNYGYANAPKCYDIHILTTLLVKDVNFSHIHCLSIQILLQSLSLNSEKGGISADDTNRVRGGCRKQDAPIWYSSNYAKQTRQIKYKEV